MALKKRIQLKSRVAGEYWRIATLRLDYQSREASVQFMLFVDEATARLPDAEALPTVAKMRLNGEDFDRVCGRSALAGGSENIIARLYAEARRASIICDAGPDVFQDAENA